MKVLRSVSRQRTKREKEGKVVDLASQVPQLMEETSGPLIELNCKLKRFGRAVDRCGNFEMERRPCSQRCMDCEGRKGWVLLTRVRLSKILYQRGLPLTETKVKGK